MNSLVKHLLSSTIALVKSLIGFVLIVLVFPMYIVEDLIKLLNWVYKFNILVVSWVIWSAAAVVLLVTSAYLISYFGDTWYVNLLLVIWTINLFLGGVDLFNTTPKI